MAKPSLSWAAIFSLIALPWLALCSEQQCVSENSEAIVSGEAVAPCSDHHMWLDTHTLEIISTYVDSRTLMYKWPLICKLWASLCPKFLAYDRIHRSYLEGLRTNGSSTMYKSAPWCCFLPDEIAAFNYLGSYVKEGVFNEPDYGFYLQSRLNEYVEAVIRCKVPLPALKDCNSQYDLFAKLIEIALGFCASVEFVFGQPGFLSNEDYWRMVHRFVCEEKLIMRLPKSWIVDNMLRLFNMVEKDEQLLCSLINESFGNFIEPSIALILSGKTGDGLEKVRGLMFSKAAKKFRYLIGPISVVPDQYYELIVERKMLSWLIARYYYMSKVTQLMVSLILFFKDRPDTIDELVASIEEGLLNSCSLDLDDVKMKIRYAWATIQSDASICSQEGARFFEEVMMRCRILKI